MSGDDDDMPGLEDVAQQPTEQRVEAATLAKRQQAQRVARMSAPAEFSDEDEGEEIEERIPCLFGPAVYSSATEAYATIAREHGLDISALRLAWSLDFYASVKLINFVRGLGSELAGGCADVTATGELRLLGRSGAVVASLTRDSPNWQADSLMTPVLADDGLLTGLEDEEEEEEGGAVSTEDISAKLQMSEQLFEQLSAMKSSSDAAAASGDSAAAGAAGSDSDSDEDGDELIRMAKRIEAADDSNYFDSYSFIEIHETMLKDKARTEAYRDAMLANRALFEGATVIDVGCGTGILSIFAVRNPNPLAVFDKTPPLDDLLAVGAPWLPSIILLARALLVVGA